MASHINSQKNKNSESDIIRAVVYRRVSSEEQAESGLGLQGQSYGCKEFLKKQFPNHELVEVYSDEGISGNSTEIYERKQLTKMMNDAKSDLFDIVVVFKSDRLARRGYQHDKLYKYFEALGIDIYEASGEKLTNADPQKRLFRTMLSAFSEFEVDQTRERIKSVKASQRAEGQYAGGDLPYGYKWHKETKTLEIVDEEIRVWLQIVNKYMIENKGGTVIANELNRAGIPYRVNKAGKATKNTWNATNILDLLKNPIITGHFASNVITKYRDDSGKKRVKRNSPREYGLHKSDLLKEFIPLDLWYQIIDKIESKRSTKPAPRLFSTSWLLSGIVKCSCCGEVLHSKDSGTKGGKTKSYKYYKCKNSLCNGDTKSFRKEELEEAVIKELKDILGEVDKDDFVKEYAVTKILEDIGQIGNELNIIDFEVNEAKAKEGKLSNELGKILFIEDEGEKKFRQDIFFDEMKKVKAELKRLTELKVRKEIEIESRLKEKESIETTLDSIMEMRALLEYDNPMHDQQKRSIILTLIDHVEVKDGQVVIELRANTGNEVPSHLLRRFNKANEEAINEVVATIEADGGVMSNSASYELPSHALQLQ